MTGDGVHSLLEEGDAPTTRQVSIARLFLIFCLLEYKLRGEGDFAPPPKKGRKISSCTQVYTLHYVNTELTQIISSSLSSF